MVAELVSVAPDGSGQQVGYIPIDKIRNDVPQVRRDWRHDEGHERLDELTQSIRNHGLLQPIEVQLADDGYYQVLVGHRRYVAAKRAGLCHVPAVVREANEQERTVLQLVENIHRQDISPEDKGQAFLALMDTRGWTQAELARFLGVAAGTVARYIHVLKDSLLTDAVKRGLISNVSAYRLGHLVPPYDRELRQRLAAGQRVSEDDVRQAHRKEHAEGVGSPNSGVGRAHAVAPQRAEALALHRQGLPAADIATRLGHNQTVVYRWLYAAGETPILKRKVRPVHALGDVIALREQGLTFSEIGTKLGGISASAAKMRYDLAVFQGNGDARGADDKAGVTVNGINIDPLIAKAQERAEHEAQQQPEAVQSAPHPRPTRSPLPWENQDEDAPVTSFPRHRAVDGSEVERSTGGPSPSPQRSPTPAAPAAPTPHRPPAPADDPVARLRMLLLGAEQPCLDMMQAVIRVGREQGWSCVELWRNVQAAADLLVL